MGGTLFRLDLVAHCTRHVLSEKRFFYSLKMWPSSGLEKHSRGFAPGSSDPRAAFGTHVLIRLSASFMRPFIPLLVKYKRNLINFPSHRQRVYPALWSVR